MSLGWDSGVSWEAEAPPGCQRHPRHLCICSVFHISISAFKTDGSFSCWLLVPCLLPQCLYLGLNSSRHPFGHELVQDECLHLSLSCWLREYLTWKEKYHVSIREGTPQSVRSGSSLSLQLHTALHCATGIVIPILQSVMLRYGGC